MSFLTKVPKMTPIPDCALYRCDTIDVIIEPKQGIKIYTQIARRCLSKLDSAVEIVGID